jgi:RES domain-containing protein
VNSRAQVLWSACFLAVAAVGTAQAHHSASVSFDNTRTIEITGEVVEWRFRNPHTLLVVDGTAVIDGVRDDVERRWEIESSAAAGLRARGVDENTLARGTLVTVRGIPHRNPTTYRANAFAGSSSFLDANGNSIFGGPENQPGTPIAPTGTGAERLAGLWRPPGQRNLATTPLALTAAGREAWERYDQRLSPANTCEPMSIPDIYNAPSYVVTIEIGDDRAVVSNQAYKVVRTIPLDGSEAPADPKQQFGIVRGRIDAGALVVESRAYPASKWGLGAATQIMGAGADVPSSPGKTVVERFSVSPDGLRLTYEYTVDDPEYLSAPFSHRVEWARLADDTQVYPYDCDVESASQFSRD